MSLPFSRSNALAARIVAIRESGMTLLNQQIEIDALEPYVSHGHGGKYRGSSSRPNMRSKFPSGKYTPYQGKQEIARRLARI